MEKSANQLKMTVRGEKVSRKFDQIKKYCTYLLGMNSTE